MSARSGLFCIAIFLLQGCYSQDQPPRIERVAGESEHVVSGNKLSISEFYVVSGGFPDETAFQTALDRLLDAEISALTKTDIDFQGWFFRQRRGLDASFMPFVPDNCFLDCDSPLHIYDVAYDDRLVTAYVKRRDCQLSRYYIFHHRRMFGGWQDSAVHRQETLSSAACGGDGLH